MVAPSSQAQTRIGVVGVGFLAETRARCGREVAGAAITAVASANPARARAYAERHAIPRAFESVEALVASDAIDAVDLCTTAGWSTPMPDEDWTSGQLAMCAAFAEAIRANAPPAADGWLGLEVTRVLYAAYRAAAEGRRVKLAAS